MINKDLDLLLLSKLLPNNENNDLFIPIKLKNELQIKVIEYINLSPVEPKVFNDYFTETYLMFNGGLNVAKVIYLNPNNSMVSYINNHTHVSLNGLKGCINADGRKGIVASTPFSNVVLNLIKKNHVESLLQSLDASITIVNNPWITSLRNTLVDLVEIMVSNQLNEIDITSLAEYCILDLIKDNSSESKKVDKLLKMIYG